jgi:hypothetical protein
LHEFTFAGGARTTLAMSGGATFPGRTETFPAKETAKRFAAHGQPFLLMELFTEVMIVEADILRACQAQDGLPGGFRQASVAGPAAIGVSQPRLPVFAQTLLQAFNVTHAQGEEFGGAGTRHVSLDACTDHAHSLQLLLTQRECLLSHGVTFSRCCSGATKLWS